MSEHYKTELGRIAYLGNKALLVKMLVNEAYHPGKEKNDALLAAIKGGHFDIVSLLCKDPRVIFYKTIETQKCPFYHASIRGNLEMVKFLWELDPSIQANTNSSLDFDLLFGTAKNKHLKVVHFLLQKEVIVNKIIPDITWLTRCAIANNLEYFVIMLLEVRPIKNLQDTILKELHREEKIIFKTVIQKESHFKVCHLLRNGFFFDSKSSLNILNKDTVDKITQASVQLMVSNQAQKHLYKSENGNQLAYMRIKSQADSKTIEAPFLCLTTECLGSRSFLLRYKATTGM